jgi:hypothetical protein
VSDSGPGYDDTPILPGGEYRVHDPDRPHPTAVTPKGPNLLWPPSDAIVLFDGGDLAGWAGVDGGDVGWLVEGDDLVVEPGSGDIRTTQEIGDCQLHLEWATPAEPRDGPYPGNSGVFLADRYEIQILNDRDATIYADGYAGAVYGQHPPLVSPFTEPGAWQSFDIVWRAPRFDDGVLETPARVTVFHNGVLVQDNVRVFGPTTHRNQLDYEPHPPGQPLRLQDHDCRVRFRNIWARPL